MTLSAASVIALLARLEELSRQWPDRVLRLRGQLQLAAGPLEPYELLIFRGFSSSTTHPTDFDPDQPLLPDGAVIETAELLHAPLNPAAEQLLAGPASPEVFLESGGWV
jgi:hypothetical protein